MHKNVPAFIGRDVLVVFIELQPRTALSSILTLSFIQLKPPIAKGGKLLYHL